MKKDLERAWCWWEERRDVLHVHREVAPFPVVHCDSSFPLRSCGNSANTEVKSARGFDWRWEKDQGDSRTSSRTSSALLGEAKAQFIQSPWAFKAGVASHRSFLPSASRAAAHFQSWLWGLLGWCAMVSAHPHVFTLTWTKMTSFEDWDALCNLIVFGITINVHDWLR